MTRLQPRTLARTRWERGFTLIEMLAVVLLLSVVFLMAINFYLDLSSASNDAAARTRSLRRGVAVLDRVARDFAAAILVRKPAELDPLEHPWLFLADAHDDEVGADRIKFVTRGHRPRSEQEAQSDLEVVAWLLHESEFGERELLRWSSPQLPEGLDRSFPGPDDEGTQLVAQGIASFGVRLLSEEGEWQSRWDSSVLLDSAELPLAAEISVSFVSDDAWEQGTEEEPYQRQVLLPLRPLDLEQLLNPEGAGDGAAEGDEEEEDGDEEDCVTVRECRGQFGDLDPDYLATILDICVSDTHVSPADCP